MTILGPFTIHATLDPKEAEFIQEKLNQYNLLLHHRIIIKT
jgi:hypothetical protein